MSEKREKRKKEYFAELDAARKLVSEHEASAALNKEATQKLVESVSLLNSFFNSPGAMRGVVEVEGNDIRHIADNAITAEFFGHTQESMINKLASEMGVDQAFIDIWIKHYEESKHKKQQVNFEYEHKTDKQSHFFSVTVNYLNESDRGFSRYSYVLLDITEQKQAQKALQEAHDELDSRIKERTAELEASNEKLYQEIKERKQAEEALQESESRLNQTVAELSAIINTLPGMISVTDLDYNILVANQHVVDKFGHSRLEEIIGKKCYEVRKGRDSICPECGVEKALETGETFVRLSTPQEKNMMGISTQAYASPIRNDEGIVWGAVEVIMDVTDLRQAEEESILLATAIEQASDSVIITDRDGMIRYVNPAFEKLSGFTQEEITGDNFRIFKSDKHDEKFYKKMWHDIYNGKVWAGRITNRMRDGTLREFETRISPVRDDSGEIINFVSVNRDITHEIELETQLHQSQKMEAIGTLAGGIAHDFNNIIGIILGNTELAMDDVSEWNPARLNLEEIRIACLRAKDVVRQLLSFASKAKLEKKPTNIIPIIKETLKLLRSSIPTSIEIRQNIPKDIDTIMADPTQINQVLINLCTNADHAMPDGGVLAVTLKNKELDDRSVVRYPELHPGRYVNLTVDDTGHGISPEEIDRVFDPYYTTKEVGKGTGMGLAVVHGIVEEHNGIITVESKLGRGTTFNIFFPVIQKDAVVKVETSEELLTGNERILFVDDEESIVKMGSQMLERLGYKVESTTSPTEALALFRSQSDQFDLIITDLTMPKMTGDKLVKEILSIRPEISIILCTGFSEKIDEKIAKTIGAADYIEKPLHKRDLAFKVREVLDEK